MIPKFLKLSKYFEVCSLISGGVKLFYNVLPQFRMLSNFQQGLARFLELSSYFEVRSLDFQSCYLISKSAPLNSGAVKFEVCSLIFWSCQIDSKCAPSISGAVKLLNVLFEIRSCQIDSKRAL